MNVTAIPPFSYQGKEIAPYLIDDKPHFVAVDVCKLLALSHPFKAIQSLEPDEHLNVLLVRAGQRRDMIMVNESGLYHLIFKSMKPEARAFRKWVTSEVLPALRQRGAYRVGEGRDLPKAQTTYAQGQLFDMPALPTGDLARARSLMLDVALQAKPGSKVAQLVRLMKPMVMEGQAL